MIGKSDMNTKLRDETRAKVRKHMNVFTVVKQLRNQPMDDRPLIRMKEGTECKVRVADDGLKLEGDVEAEEVLLEEEMFAGVLNDGPQIGQMCPQTLDHMPGIGSRYCSPE